MVKRKRKPAAMKRTRQPSSVDTVFQLKPNDFIIHNYNALHNIYLANKDWKPLSKMSPQEIARRYSLKYDNQYVKPTREELDA